MLAAHIDAPPGLFRDVHQHGERFDMQKGGNNNKTIYCTQTQFNNFHRIR